MRKIGLICSGAGTYGPLEVGGVAAFYNSKIMPGELVTTSAGSIIGAMLSLGYQPAELLHILMDANFAKLIPLSKWKYILLPFRGYVASNSNVTAWLKEITDNKTCSELKIPLITITTDLTLGREVPLCTYQDKYKDVPIWQIILPSMSIPDIFPAFNKRYIDGGVADNLGVNYLHAKGLKKIALRVDEPMERKKTTSFLEEQIRLVNIMLSTNERDMTILAKAVDTDVINLPATAAGFLDTTMSKAQKMNLYEIGYNAVSDYLDVNKNDPLLFGEE